MGVGGSKAVTGDFLVKNPPATAEDRFDPWSRKLPRVEGQVSLWRHNS